MKEKTAVITGAGSGIGRATALAFARKGYVVFVTDILEAEGNDVVSEIKRAGGKAFFKTLDVSRTEQVDAVVSEVEAAFDRVDTLVANAGIALRAPIAQMTDKDWDSMLDIDLKGVFRVARAVAPMMRKHQTGAIVAVSSISGMSYGWAEHVHYSAAKAGLLGLVRGLAAELGPDGVRVNGVAPGFIRTAQSLSEDCMGPNIDAQAKRVPLRRIGEPDDVADVITFLASSDARYLTGQTILVDGGLTIQQ
jgi:3-oxoacyl-[acyl-carrier protein] reductase